MLIFNYNYWEEWSNPQLVTFDPENKLIWINSGVTNLDVGIDLYSNWKEWVKMYDNAKWAAAFYTFGGDPTGSEQYAPAYYFLINGWKVKAANIAVVVQTNLYSQDGLSPFIIENAAVTNRTSDVPIVKSEIDKRLNYGDKVYFDSTSSYAGTTYPNGTIAQPVINMTDAILIANLYNITKIYLRTDVTLSNSYNLVGFDLYADMNNIVVTSIVNDLSLNNTRFYGLTVRGTFGGSDISIKDGYIDDIGISEVNGDISFCEISSTIEVDNNIVISNCHSGKAGTSPGLVVNMNTLTQSSVSIRSYSGGVKILNCGQGIGGPSTGDTITIELVAGRVLLDSTCISGTIDIRGVGYLVDNSSGTTVITTGFVDSFETYVNQTKFVDEQLAYDNKIYIDTIVGVTGTTYPVGTYIQPVNNFPDFFAISDRLKIKNVHLRNDIIVSGMTDDMPPGYEVKDFSVYADRAYISMSIYDCVFFDHNLYGFEVLYAEMNGLRNNFINCNIGDIYDFTGTIEKSGLIGEGYIDNFKIRLLGNTTFIDCYPAYTGYHPHIQLVNSGGTNVSFRNYSGGINIDKVEHPDDYLVIDLNSGMIVLESGCTNGYIELRGVGYLENHAGSGCTINTLGFVDSFESYAEETRAIQERLSYDNKVYIDAASGVTGTTYPAGTYAYPVKEIMDMLYIGRLLNIGDGRSKSNLVLNSIPVPVSNFSMTGEFPELTFTLTDGENMSYAKIINFIVKNSDFKGKYNQFLECELENVIGLKGLVENCRLTGRIDNTGSTIGIYDNTTFINCYLTYTGYHVYINLDNPSGTNVSFRNYTGGLNINKVESPNDYLVIDLNSGHIVLESGCTNGNIEIRGVGRLENYAGSGCTVNTDGFITSTEDILMSIDSKISTVSGLTLEMNDNVIYMTDQISGMTSGFTDITASIDNMAIQVESLDQKVSFISGTTYEMNQNVLYMTSGFTDIQSGFTDITASIDNMAVQVESLDQKVSFISGTTYEMNENVLIMTSGFTDIENSISGMTDAVNTMAEQVNEMFISVNNLDAQIKRILGLTQENFRITDHVYGSDNTLISATIKIYSNSSDCDSDINPLETYSMTALYDSSSRLTNYKVIRN